MNDEDSVQDNAAGEPLGEIAEWEPTPAQDRLLDDLQQRQGDSLASGAALSEEVLLDTASDANDSEAWDREGDELATPIVAIVGRPNVGKSTLVNRILGRREAVVEDVPGVTRDRVTYAANWAGREFQLMDTGGWLDRVEGMSAQVAEQARRGAEQADVVVMVVDATVGATGEDEDVIRLLQRSGKPVLLVANKVDDARGEADAASLWSLGVGQPHPVSALHGRGSGDLLDALLGVLPEVGSGRNSAGGPRRVALLGRPNVGKSSLLNRLAGEQRSVVDSVAGTTVDPVDELITLGDHEWVFVDTAGIRRRIKQASGHEYYASLRTRSALDRAEVAVVLIDGSEPVAEADLRIIDLAVQSGRALVLAINKWDLVDDERRRYIEREVDRDLGHIGWAPRVNVSALTGRRVRALLPGLERALAGWETRVSTGRLNAFLREVADSHPHPVRGGKQPRVLFGTQVATRPPTFVLFTSGALEAGYLRFLERRLREEFGFEGSPLVLNQRVRAKRKRR